MDNDDKKKIPVVDDKQGSRRKLLKSVAVGGGAVAAGKMLPEQWARPVVDSVMLPSHAQTSDPSLGAFAGSGAVVQNESATQMAEQGFSEELLEFFTPAANAGPMIMDVELSLTSNASGNSYLCGVDAYSDPEWVSVQIENQSFTSDKCLLGGALKVNGGTFVDGKGWKVNVSSPNVTTDITLKAGGSGCDQSFGVKGSCIHE